MSDNSTERSLTVDTAAGLFAQMNLDGDTVEETVEEESQEAAPEADEGEVEAEESESEEGVEESEEDATPAPKTYRVKVGGEELEVPEEEVVKGYLRTADYTRKTQELAEKRKAFESHAQAVLQERQRYAQTLTQLQQMVAETSAEPDWPKLRAELPPEEYAREVADWQLQKERENNIKQELENVAHLQQQDNFRARAARLDQEREALLLAVPEWKDSAKAKREMNEMAEYVASQGFPAGTFDAIEDHKIFLLVRNALRYEKLLKQKPGAAPAAKQATAATVTATSTVKPLAAGSAVTSKKVTNDLTRAKQRLAKTGSEKDAASVFEHFI